MNVEQNKEEKLVVRRRWTYVEWTSKSNFDEERNKEKERSLWNYRQTDKFYEVYSYVQ